MSDEIFKRKITEEETRRIILQVADGLETPPVADLKILQERITPYTERGGRITIGNFNLEKGTLSIALQYSFQKDVVDSQFYVQEPVVLEWMAGLVSFEKAQQILSFCRQGDTFHARLEELRGQLTESV